MSHTLDRMDRKILKLLQEDCRQPVSDIADAVGLSKSACHRRVKALTDAGIIDRFTATLRPDALGYHLVFSIDVRLKGQSDEVLRRFESDVMEIAEVLECQLMTGETDYTLRVVARDSADYERIHHRLARLPGVSTLVSRLVLRTVKKPSGMPLPEAGR